MHTGAWKGSGRPWLYVQDFNSTAKMSFPFGIKTVTFYTLGCKLNQLESESIADAFRRQGFKVVPWNANTDTAYNGHSLKSESILIINTCTVTSKSEQKARRIIRKALRETSFKMIIVSGCYAQMDKAALESLEYDSLEHGSLESNSIEQKRLFVIPQDEKHILLKLPETLSGRIMEPLSWKTLADQFINNQPSPDTSFCYEVGRFTFHSRAFVKIQDGCNKTCAYCRTRIARGKSRSLEPEKALAVLKALEEEGYDEAVLTGVNISQYHDKTGCSGLPALLEYLVSGTSGIRLRLSSIEPDIIDAGFVRAVSHNRIRPHFHISLQSGSRAVLERMKRHYVPEQVLEGIRLLRTAKEDPFLGCDIIAGFPGETPDDFEKTLDFAQKACFTGIHAFPFSRRPGTEALNMTGNRAIDRITERETGLRIKRLNSLAARQRQDYIKRWIGREVEAIIEEDTVKLQGYLPALSENYLKLLIKAGSTAELKPAKAYNCRIVSDLENYLNIPKITGFDAVAEIIAPANT